MEFKPRNAPPVSKISAEASVRSEQQVRKEKAPVIIAKNVTKSLGQAEALSRQAEAHRLAFLPEIQKIRENASRMQVTLNKDVRRSEAEEYFYVVDVDEVRIVQAPPTHTI